MKNCINYIFIILFSIAFTISCLYPLSCFWFVAALFFFLFFFYNIFKGLLNFQLKFQPVNISKTRILIYALSCIIVWCFYLIAFFPGVMTSDSIGQWKEMLSGHYSDWHPAVHTYFNFLITRIWLSPAAVAFSQIIILSLTFGYGMYTFEKAGVPKNIIYVALSLFSLYPVNGIFSITLWKDILFSGFILLFTILIINILLYKAWIESPYNKVLFIFAGLGTMLFRHNGVISFIGTALLLLWVFRKNIKSYAICVTFVIVIYIVIKGPIYKLANVQPASSSEAFGIPIQQIAAVIHYNGKITDNQLKEIDEIMLAHFWGEKYIATNVDYVKFAPGFNRDLISNNKLKFLSLWWNICVQNPKIVAVAYLNQTKSIWQIRETGTINIGSREIEQNSLGLKQKVIFKPITLIANVILNITRQPFIICLFWKPALFMFILIFTAYISYIKGFKLMIVAAAPVFLNIATLLLAVPAQDFRYLYSSALVVIPLVLFSLIKPVK